MTSKTRDAFTLQRRGRSRGFTLIELLVVIAIISVLAAFAVPALTQALVKGQMTGTMNNARQMYLAGFQMATDGATNADPNYAWPGEFNPAITNLSDYCAKLVTNGYLKIGALGKMLSAPSATCTVTGSVDANGAATITFTGTPAVKVYKIKDSDASNTIFAVTNNYTYNTALNATSTPYGDKGFVVMRKGGDASVLRKNQATAALATSGDATRFQGLVGKLTGDNDGSLGTESSSIVLGAK